MKLKSKDLDLLKKLCPGNRVPEYPDPRVDGVYNLEASIQISLEKERSRMGLGKMSPARRSFYGVSTLNVCFKGDGLVTGVVINDPELIAAAIEGAKAMKLQKAAKILAKVERELPAESTWKNLRKREKWFETPAGQRAATKLAILEEDLSDAEEPVGFVEACILYALANPSEFFESPSKRKAGSGAR